MRFSRRHTAILVSLAALVAALPLGATTLLKMDLADMTGSADKIFRGTVVDVEQGTIAAGGGEIPAVTYRLRVEEMFKGDPTAVKGDGAMVEIQLVGSVKEPQRVGDLVRMPMFHDVPRLRMGSDYLLFVTPQSSIGLSMTVGLGQGAFDVFSRNKEDFAINQFGNVGLGFGPGGPVSYDALAAEIKTLLGQ